MKICFIIGTGRSGTGILSNMLGLHNNILNYGETHFLPTLIFKYGNESVENKIDVIFNHPSSEGRKQPWQNEETKIIFKQICKKYNATTNKELVELFLQFGLSNYNTNLVNINDYYIIDKTPHYGLFGNELLKIWKDAKFIHIIRNKVKTMESMQKHSGFTRLIRSKLIDKFKNGSYLYDGKIKNFDPSRVDNKEMEIFYDYIINTIKLNTTKEYIEIQYEELMNEPNRILTDIYNFLNIPVNNNKLSIALIKK